jgi:hypothetical protein
MCKQDLELLELHHASSRLNVYNQAVSSEQGEKQSLCGMSGALPPIQLNHRSQVQMEKA